MKVVAPFRTKGARTLVWFALVVLFAVPARAQLTVGDNLQMNMNGSLGYGYSAGYGDAGSAHGQSVVAEGVLNGSYYNRNFLSFTVRPYWDRMQNNTTSAFTSRDNGIDTSASLFSGSFTPVNLSFSKTYSSAGQFGVPGVTGIETNGSGQSFGIGASESIPGLPPLYANFSMGSGSYTALGTDGENTNSNRNFNAGTNYELWGFHLTGSYNWANWNYAYSNLFGFDNSGSGSSQSISLGAQHPLPLHGGLSVTYGHSSYGNDSNAGMSGSMNTAMASSTFMPLMRLSISGQMQYTSNVTASLMQQQVPGGGFTILDSGTGSHAISMSSAATYSIGHGWNTNGYVTRTSVSFRGREFDNVQYGGTVNYHFQRGFMKMFRVSAGLVDLANKEGNGGLAMVGAISADRAIGRWETSADFAYSQDVQTLYGIAATSNYSYGGSIRRKISRDMFWSGVFRAGHSGLQQQAGNSSGSESFSSNFAWNRYSFGGSYSQSRGTSIFTSTGLITPTPVAGLITTNSLFYNGHSFSVSGSTRLLRRFNVTGVYSKSRSDLDMQSLKTFSDGQAYSATVDCRMRKLSLMGGFTRGEQDGSSVKNGPYLVNSFYFRVSRWFNVF